MDFREETSVVLVRPAAGFKSSYLNGFCEMAADSELRAWAYLPNEVSLGFPSANFEEYVAALLAREHTPPRDYVCDTVYWGLLGNEIVGRIAIRHELNEFLASVGGHIGYIVRPPYRRQGFASEMLRQVLKTDRAKSIGRLLVTCDEDNAASEKTILKNGGVFEGMIEAGPDKPRKKRFWIDA